jgi:ribosomal protein L7/L12
MPSASVQPSPCDVPAAPVLREPLSQAAVTALGRGQIVKAIELVRAEENIGLNEAKAYVEAYVQAQPVLRNQIIQARADAREGLFRWLVFVLVGGGGLFFFLA